MRSLAIIFTLHGAAFGFDQSVLKFSNETQNILINFGTAKGSDPVHPNRGVDLHAQAFQTSMSTDFNELAHQANFAVLDTVNTLREFPVTEDSVQKLALTIQPIGEQRFRLNVTATSASGEEIGRSIT